MKHRRDGYTLEEFERDYAERSQLTIEELHQWGRHADPCDCDYEGCEGWAMGYQWEEAIFELQQHIRAGDRRAAAARTGALNAADRTAAINRIIDRAQIDD